MTEPAISVRNLSKCYKLGTIGRHTLVDEAQYLWHKIRGKDPREHFSKIGHTATEARRVEAEQEGNQEFWALKDVSFDVQPGEVIGIIGRNGAGKSTLLKILTRITEPTSGEAFINGRVASLLEVGTGFHPELTGRENVYMNGTILGMKKREIDAKFDEIVAFSELEKFIDTPVKRYSSGMYVRLAFAVAAHLDPEILLIDEVLAVGDMEFQKKCLGKMQDVSESGRTVFFVSHNMAAVSRLCTRSLVLINGELSFDGDTPDAVSKYTAISLKAEACASWSDKDAPGSNGFRLKEVSVRGIDDEPVGSVDIRQPLCLKIRFSLDRDKMKFRCAMALYTQGVCAFTTIEKEEREYLQAGEHCLLVRLPGNILSEGEYLVGVSVFASRGVKSHFCRIPDAVAFHVSDCMDGGSARGDYAEGLGGVVRPNLEWVHE
ncbi:MAG: hypothetical protein A2283_10465 [Lentisphaerae bacterium RIFOXYA12_FULL_48_11]|nr:MAG: hypothetical protein A2283_10465 [Lentisphaerae bacterium RIFOXYA12_FULL_48_11]